MALDYVNSPSCANEIARQVEQSTVSTNVTGEIIRFDDTDYLEILEPTTLLYSCIPTWSQGSPSG